MNKSNTDKLHMDIALRAAQESKCPRKQVGCCLLLESGMIAIGFNGHASGGPNEWEFKEQGDPEVVHAELNCLGKLLEEGLSAKGATTYITYSPCLDCAKLLVRAKVKRVVYLEEYRKTEGIDYLAKYGVQVEKYSEHSHCFPCVATIVRDDRTEVYEFTHCVSKHLHTSS
ncbi:tRNA-specific adenosine deaminase [compost metagenome]